MFKTLLMFTCWWPSSKPITVGWGPTILSTCLCVCNVINQARQLRRLRVEQEQYGEAGGKQQAVKQVTAAVACFSRRLLAPAASIPLCSEGYIASPAEPADR